MNSVVIAIGAIVLYLIAYNTYGKFLARKIFKINPKAAVPSKELQDDVDFVPTKKSILFGHHFTSIAGAAPIVGPAIAIIWGWVPALIWVIFGSIFMGAVHDFGAVVISMRNQGRSIGDIAADLVNKRVRMIFLFIIFLLLLIVVAVFCVVIGAVFSMYPGAVLPVFLEIPIAVWLGYMVYKKKANHVTMSIIAVVLMYITVVIGAYYPISMTDFGISPGNAIAAWVVLLLVYAYIASVLPVQILLQPRDYINSHQLFIALGILLLGILVAHPTMVAPTTNFSPSGAPPIWPMLFITIACGALSGFHALVSSGTTSKQIDSESSALTIGYGGMLMEGLLSTFVIIACGAGLAIGLADESGTILTGSAAFSHHYASWGAAAGLGSKVGAFVHGAANIIESIGIPHNVALVIMGVFVASFAATTLDTATRLQRYIVAEIGVAINVPPMAKKHPATAIAVLSALVLSFSVGASGKGGLILWPLFGTTNQLLASLALLVTAIYLARRKAPIIFSVLPMIFIIFMTAWAMKINLINYYDKGNWLLFSLGLIVVVLEIWMVIESLIVLFKVYGKEPEVATS